MDHYFDLSFVRISTWGWQSLLITSPGEVLSNGGSKNGPPSRKRRCSPRAFCSISSRLFPLLLRAWIHGGDAAETADKNGESSEGNQQRQPVMVLTQLLRGEGRKRSHHALHSSPLWGVTTVNLFFKKKKKHPLTAQADYIYVIFSHFFVCPAMKWLWQVESVKPRAEKSLNTLLFIKQTLFKCN